MSLSKRKQLVDVNSLIDDSGSPTTELVDVNSLIDTSSEKKNVGGNGANGSNVSSLTESTSPSIVNGNGQQVFPTKENPTPYVDTQQASVPEKNITPSISNNFGMPSATDLAKQNSALRDNTQTLSIPVLKQKNVLGEDVSDISDGEDEGVKLAKEYANNKKILDNQHNILNSQILNTYQDIAVTKGDTQTPKLFTPIPIKEENKTITDLEVQKNEVTAKANELRDETIKKAGLYASKINANATTAGLTTRAILGDKAAIQQSDFLDKGLPIAPSDLFYNDQQGLEALSKGVDEQYKDDLQNPDYIAKKSDIENQYKTLIDKYPEFKRQQVAKIVAQEIMKEHPNADGMMILPYGIEAAKKLGLSEEDIKNIDFDNLPIQSPLSSAAGAVYNGIIGLGAGAARILGTTFGMDKDVLTSNLGEATRNATARFEDVSNTQGLPTIVDADKTSPTYLQDVVNPEAGKYNYNFHTISNAIGHGVGALAQFIGGTKAIGGIAKNILPVVDATEAGMAGLMVGQGYEPYYQKARETISDKPEDEWKRHAYALINGSLDYYGFKALGKVVKSVSPSLEEEAANIFKDASSLSQVNRNALTKWTEKVIKGVEQTVGETAFVGGAQAGSEIAKNIVDNTIGTGDAGKKSDREIGGVLLSGVESLPFAIMIPVGLSKVISGARGSYVYKENIYNSGLNPETYLGQATKLFHDGIITQEQLNQRAQVINTATKVVNSIPSDIELNHNQRVAYTNSKVRELALKAQKEKIDDTALEKFYDEQIKQEVDARTEILNGGSKEPPYVKPETNETVQTETKVPDTTEIASTTNEAIDNVSQKAESGTNEADLINQAKDIVNTDVVKGFSAETLKDAANNKPKDFKNYLSEIAQQAYDENSVKATVDTYGQPLVDIATKLFPKEETQAEQQPIVNSNSETQDVNKALEGLNKTATINGNKIKLIDIVDELSTRRRGDEYFLVTKNDPTGHGQKTTKEAYNFVNSRIRINRDIEKIQNVVEQVREAVLQTDVNKVKEIVENSNFNKDNLSVIQQFHYSHPDTPISEAYHKSKEDGSNPELVKAVEDLINKNESNRNTTTEVSPKAGVSSNSNEGVKAKDKYDINWKDTEDWEQNENTNRYEVGSTKNFDIEVDPDREGIIFNFKDENRQKKQVEELDTPIVVNLERDRSNRVHINGISESNLNKGFGKEIYHALLDNNSIISTSSASASNDAQRVWNSLIKSGEYYWAKLGTLTAVSKNKEPIDRFIEKSKSLFGDEEPNIERGEPIKNEPSARAATEVSPKVGVSSNSNEDVQVGFTPKDVIDDGFRKLKSEIGEKKAKKYFEQVDRLLSPNENTIVEYRKNGVVTKEGDKYIFHPLADMDLKNWRIAKINDKVADVTAQFESKKTEPSNERTTTEDNPTIPANEVTTQKQGNKEPLQPSTESTGRPNAETETTVLKEGKYKAKAKKIADNIRQSELPSWLVNTDPTIKKSGVSAESLKNAFADAVELAGELLDKGVEVKDALKQAADKIIDHILTDYPKGAKLKSERESQIRDGFEKYYNDNILKGEEIKSESGKGNKPPTNEVKVAEGEDNTIGIRHVDTAEMREEKSLPEYEKKATTIVEINAEADKRIKEGKMPKLIQKLEEGGGLSGGVEQSMMGKYIAELNDVAEKNPTKENIAALDKAMYLNDVAGTAGFGQVGRVRQERFLPENSFGESLKDEAMSLGVEMKDLPKEVIEKVSQEHKELEKLRKDLAKSEAENERLRKEKKAQSEIQKIVKSSKNKPKEKRDFKSERQSLKEKLKKQFEDYKAAGNKLGITSDGGVESFIISAKMAKTIGEIVKNYADEGISKFDDLINKTFEDVKDVLGKVSKNDIIDVMAGVYNEKRPTRSELTMRMRGIRTEATLLKKLNDLRLGKEPTTKQGKAEKNQRITDLENRIKEIRKNNNDDTPVEKTEGQRLAAKVKAMLKKIDDIQADVKAGKFEKEERLPPVILDKKALAIQDRLIELEAQQAMRRAKQDYDELSRWDRSMDTFWQIAGLRRLVNAAVDFSILFRQASPITMNPFKYIRIENGRIVKGTAPKAIINMFNLAFNPKGFKRFQYNIEKTEAGRLFTHFDGTFSNPSEVRMEKREEEFTNSLLSRIGQKIEMGDNKNLKKAAEIADRVWFSERAAAALLNTIRIEEFSRDVKNLRRNGITPENNPKAYKDAVKWSMNITGRGNMVKVLEDSHAGRLIANRTYFGARLMAAKINMLNPLTYARMEPKMRERALKDMVGATTGFAMLALAGIAAGGQVSLNPDEPDFLQLRFGDKVFDLTGGSVAYVRTFLRFIKAIGGQIKKPNSRGANSYTTFAGKSIIKSLVVNKLSPNNAYLYHFWTRKSGQYDESGHLKPFDPYEIVRIYPMYIDGTVSAYEKGGLSDALTIMIPDIFGIGTQQYTKKNKKKLGGGAGATSNY